VAKDASKHNEHLTHVLHQLQNKPWAACTLLVFFLTFTMGVLAFMLFNKLHQAGWSPVLFRVMQG
jgi:hypothetical protein